MLFRAGRFLSGSSSALARRLLFVLALAACETSGTIHADDGGGADAGVDDGGGGDAGGDAGADGSVSPLRSSLVVGAHEVLFVGNSYVFTNDVSGRYAAIVTALAEPEVRVETALAGGYTLARHAVDAATDGTPLAGFLRTGDRRAFDVVILQEQSQIGGFPEGNAERVGSLEAASSLASLAEANGSAVVLYATWGRERGDADNAALFPDYGAMQDRLDAGYRGMAARLRTEGHRVRIAPVGAGFRRIHDAMVTAGEDPTVEGSAFDRLYEVDGAHPSIEGGYLASCILSATITGTDPLGYPDPTGLGTEGVDPSAWAILRTVASEVMRDAAWATELE